MNIRLVAWSVAAAIFTLAVIVLSIVVRGWFLLLLPAMVLGAGIVWWRGRPKTETTAVDSKTESSAPSEGEMAAAEGRSAPLWIGVLVALAALVSFAVVIAGVSVNELDQSSTNARTVLEVHYRGELGFDEQALLWHEVETVRIDQDVLDNLEINSYGELEVRSFGSDAATATATSGDKVALLERELAADGWTRSTSASDYVEFSARVDSPALLPTIPLYASQEFHSNLPALQYFQMVPAAGSTLRIVEPCYYVGSTTPEAKRSDCQGGHDELSIDMEPNGSSQPIVSATVLATLLRSKQGAAIAGLTSSLLIGAIAALVVGGIAAGFAALIKKAISGS
jgi:hypothetical protein